MSDFTIQPYCCLTSLSNVHVRWTEQCNLKFVPQECWDDFNAFDWRGSPMEVFTDVRLMKQYAYDKIVAGEVGPEYIGSHGVGGFL